MRLHLFLFEPSHWEGFLKSIISSNTLPLTICIYVCFEMWATTSCQSTADDISLGIGLCRTRASCGRRECPGQPWRCVESRLAGFSPQLADGSTGIMCCWTRETLSGPTQAFFQSVQKRKKHGETDRLLSRLHISQLAHLPVSQIRPHSHQEPVVDVEIVNGVQSHPHCLKRPS